MNLFALLPGEGLVRSAIYHPGDRPSLDAEFVLILDVSAFRAVRNKFLCLYATQAMVFYYSSLNRLRQYIVWLYHGRESHAPVGWTVHMMWGKRVMVAIPRKSVGTVWLTCTSAFSLWKQRCFVSAVAGQYVTISYLVQNTKVLKYLYWFLFVCFFKTGFLDSQG
jgi:hypothetical protein